MHAATGKERLIGTRRVRAIHRRFEHRLQAPLRGGHQVPYGPRGERVFRVDGGRTQFLRRLGSQARVQLGDNLEIGRQSSQFRRGA